MMPELGLIEGFFGRPWSWAERADAVRFLRPARLSLLPLRAQGRRLAAPPLARALSARPSWPSWRPSARSAAPPASASASASARSSCTSSRTAAGRTRSPPSSPSSRCSSLADLAIFFDDMRGDLPDLAERQAAIVHFAAERGRRRAHPLLPELLFRRPDPRRRLRRSARLLSGAARPPARPRHPAHLDRRGGLRAGVRPATSPASPSRCAASRSSGTTIRSMTARGCRSISTCAPSPAGRRRSPADRRPRHQHGLAALALPHPGPDPRRKLCRGRRLRIWRRLRARRPGGAGRGARRRASTATCCARGRGLDRLGERRAVLAPALPPSTIPRRARSSPGWTAIGRSSDELVQTQ